jgi:hypothetical protein
MSPLPHPPTMVMLLVSGFALLLVALEQLPVLGQILVPVLLIHAGFTWLRSRSAQST